MKKKVNGECFPGIRFLLLCAVMLAGLGLLLLPQAASAEGEPVTGGGVTFSVGGGTYDGPLELTISCDPGWLICYTTDGSSPSESNGLYFEPRGLGYSNPVELSISDNCIISAIPYRYKEDSGSGFGQNPYDFQSGMSQTYIITGSKVLQDGVISFSPGPDTFQGPQDVTVSGPEGWTICYTTDGSSPIKGDDLFNYPAGYGHSNPVTIPVSENCRIRAVAYKLEGIYSSYSNIADQLYIVGSADTVQDGAVSFSPGGGVYENTQQIVLSCDPEWKICYTTNGSSPIDEDNTPLRLGNSNPVVVELTGSCIIKAVAYKERGVDFECSDIAEQAYWIYNEGSVTIGAVSFLPGEGVYEGAQEIVLSCDPDWKICYTTDGSSPISEVNMPQGLGCSNPVTVVLPESCTIKAAAYKELDGVDIDFECSDIAEQDYYILEPYSISLYAPVFASVFEGYSLPEPEPLTVVSTGTRSVTITSVALSGPDADCFVLNNTDGMWISAGGIDNVSYSIGIIDGLAAGTYTATVTAEYNGGETASAEVSCTVNEWDAAAAPVISPAAGTYSAVQQVELFCSTEDASIYYTTDGTDPDSAGNGILYTGPITVFTDTTVKAIAVKPGLKRSTVTEAAYTMDLTLFYGANDVFLGAERQPVSFRFTSAGDCVYRFYSDSQEISPSITVYDGDNQIEYHTGMYQSHHCIAELEGGKEYTVKIESLHGTGNITVRVNPTRLYNIFADPSAEHGTVTVSQGALPAADSGTLGRAYAGAEVYFSAEPEEGYGLADFSVVNTVGRVLSREPAVIMPWGGVTVRAHFDTVHMLFWPSEEESDEHANLEVVWINDGGMGAWGEGREVVRGQTVGLRWTFDDGYDADAFTLVTAGGTPVDWTYAWDNDNKKIIQFTMPGEDVYTAMTSRAFSFDNADFILPADTRSVEANAFQGDTYIIAVVIPDLCGNIGQEAFKDCTNLSYIRIPQGCRIGEDAFDGCRWVRIYGTEGSPAWQYCETHDNCTFVKE